MVERASGIRARYDLLAAGSERIRLGFEFDSYHEQYNRATENAAAQGNDLSALYRTRRNFEPTATVAIAGPITWTVGLSFQQLEQPYPVVQTESSNALVSSLRYDKKWDETASGKHRFSAGYSLRAATGFLGSAYAYTRHAVDATYHWKRGHQSAEATFLAGGIAGTAPLFDRFVLGNSVTLRGWDKFELDPLGGGRVVYGSAEYGYRMMRVFYDSGSIWDKGAKAGVKKSAGIGLKIDGILLAVAFPIRNDRMEPVFIAGMNF
jgi:outer membrane protein assembly factor BamA